MFRRQYYYLVAGFADLVFDSGKGYHDLYEFREDLKHHLHPSDYDLVSLLFLPYDNENFMAFTEERLDEWNPLGNFSLNEFEEERRILQSIIRRKKDVIPRYMVKLLEQHMQGNDQPDKVLLWKKLTEGYIKMVLESGNRFLGQWISFDRDLRNILALINAKALDLDAGKYIVGDDNFALELMSILDSGKEIVIPAEPEYAHEIYNIATNSDFLDRERKIDLERWNFIDSITFFEYFTIDLILGYVIKYSMVLRWKELDPETGKAMLQKMIMQMETQVIS